MYFANLVDQGLLDQDTDKEKGMYQKSLESSDVLLPDGIALQLLYRVLKSRNLVESEKKWLHNLNGTDFIVFFLEQLIEEYPDAQIILFG